jgi:hypothetical protein
MIEKLGLGFVERHTDPCAGAANRVDDHVAIRLPCAQHLVEPVGGERAHEGLHRRRRQPVRIDFARRLGHPEMGQRAVAVEGDVLRFKLDHGDVLSV